MALIDLDQPGRFPPVSGDAYSQARRWIASVVLFVVGGLVGGLVTHRWQADELREADASVVSVIALADFSGGPGLVKSFAGVGGKANAVSLDAHVTIVNTGPMAVDVLEITVEEPGLALLGYTGGRIGPAATMAAQLEFQIDCAASRSLLAVPASLLAETAAGGRRKTAMTIGGNPWAQQVEAACAGAAPRPGR